MVGKAHDDDVQGFDQQYVGTSQSAAFQIADGDLVYRFSPKHRWSLKNNPLSGITLPQWLRVLASHGHEIEWGGPYLLRVVFVSTISVLNSVLALVEDVMFSRAISRQRLHPAPVFIVGHPRTGTTLMHNLLAQDTHRFATCSTFCAGFPS
mmetsp:Transcript_9541/g.15066  ORF Transcript_9541/g.15066 Transcript_9541/m.15066 type:complete len:151 (+) Transcript_9541:216-668(+)